MKTVKQKAKANQRITINGVAYRLRMTDQGVEVRVKWGREVKVIPLAVIAGAKEGQLNLL